MITLDDVSVELNGTAVLHDITLTVEARTIAVIGENGSGKSTFARLAGGLVGASKGTIRIFGLDPDQHRKELRRRTAVIFSNPDTQILMPTVAEDVAFSLRSDPASVVEKHERVESALARFGLTDLAEYSAHDLSGGQKQLLALCGAFVRNPDLIVADEPTAFLDARNAHQVAEHLLSHTGHQLIVVTHDLELARRCETGVLFADGRIVRVGPPETVINDYQARLSC